VLGKLRTEDEQHIHVVGRQLEWMATHSFDRASLHVSSINDGTFALPLSVGEAHHKTYKQSEFNLHIRAIFVEAIMTEGKLTTTAPPSTTTTYRKTFQLTGAPVSISDMLKSLVELGKNEIDGLKEREHKRTTDGL
jgi:hypothetical protein